MAKKQTSSSSSSTPRRRTVKAPTQVPVDGATVAPVVSIASDTRLSALGDLPEAPRTPEPTYDDIAQAAYLRYLNRGGGDGRDFEDWVEAERELRRR